MTCTCPHQLQPHDRIEAVCAVLDLGPDAVECDEDPLPCCDPRAEDPDEEFDMGGEG